MGCVNSLKTEDPKTGTLANSEDPDEMMHYAAFHLGLQCLRRNLSEEKDLLYLFLKL